MMYDFSESKCPELYDKALLELCLIPSEIERVKLLEKVHIPELENNTPNAILIWLKTGEKIIFIDA